MSTSNVATFIPNDPPAYSADAATVPVSNILELRYMISLLHAHTRDAFVNCETRLASIRSAVDAPPSYRLYPSLQ
ncbi:hypothetical protein RSOLAG1IB_08551 [Rhizoctonia solani AG-1 IB]|uniref:Uncharacterized protein n=1 Tax=Thanatephorus cucumeris (strain AG1-IB / isolate 7/3/14) TaxID=1108050 RepID=A0A0B7FND5_THACB|nr:hypothetical protein RSOLAG1IB_08551 [Rhizoctonia solani AG-1 IB]